MGFIFGLGNKLLGYAIAALSFIGMLAAIFFAGKRSGAAKVENAALRRQVDNVEKANEVSHRVHTADPDALARLRDKWTIPKRRL